MVFAASPAHAQRASQPADAGDSDAIVVTARKVAENIQDVPVAVTAVSGVELAERGDTRVLDLAGIAPGFTLRESNSSPSALIITSRGQIQTDILATLDPSVGTYVDGVYWARAYGANGGMVDASSVQVLRGPQGTLFGRNTSAGAILLTTNNPDPDGFSARMTGTFAEFGRIGGEAVVNAPLASRGAVRIAAAASGGDGTVDDPVSGLDYNDSSTSTVRGKLLFDITDNLSLNLSAEQFKYQSRGPARNLLFARAPTTSVFAGATAFIKSAGNTPDKSTLNNVPDSFAETHTYSATFNWNIGPGDLKFIASTRDTLTFAALDLDGSPFFVHLTRGDQDLEQDSYELQYTGAAFNDRLSYVLGALYFTESGKDISRTVTFGNAASVTYFEGDIDNSAQGYYAQGTLGLTDRLNVTAGVRYSEEEKGIVTRNSTRNAADVPTACAVPTLTTLAAGCAIARNNSFDGTSYTIGADFHLTDDLMVYAKRSTGFRSGGQNLRARGNASTANAFLPEEAEENEIGLRSEWFGRALRFNLSAYQTKVMNVQRSTIVSTPSGNATILGNAAEMEVTGAELEINWSLTDAFSVFATGSVVDPDYVSYRDASGDRSNERFSGVPDSEYSLGFMLSQPVSFGKLSLRADYAWQNDYATAEFNTRLDPNVNQIIAATTAPAAGVLNARAALSMKNVEFAIFGRNLTDNRDRISGLYVPGLEYVSGTYRDPRIIGASVTLRFDGGK